MKTTMILVSVLAATAVFLSVPSAHAELVSHSSEGVLFAETFEGQTLGATLDTAHISPDGQSEEWVTTVSGAGVAEAVNTLAYYGSQSAHIGRLPTGVAEVHADFATDITSGTLTAEFAGYVPSTVPGNVVPIQVRFDEDDEGVPGSDDDIAFQLRWNTNDNKLWYKDSGGNNADTGLAFTDDTWHVYKLEYNFAGTDSVVLTVDNGTPVVLNTLLEDPTLSFVNFRIAQDGGEFYFDATSDVPEPTSGALLGVAACGLALWGWRRRRG